MLSSCMKRFWMESCICCWILKKIPYRLMLKQGTVDLVFILRRLAEKFRPKTKKFFFLFVNLQKIFSWVPREVNLVV